MLIDKYKTGLDYLYKLEDIKKDYEEIISLEPERTYLAIHKKDIHVYFMLLEFSRSNIDGTDVDVNVLWNGYGPSEGLRELRHSNFGDDGYVFYFRPLPIVLACKYLTKYFDEMEVE